MPKKQLKVKRIPTKQQLTRRQRERKIQRITLYAGVSLISLVLLFLLVGFYDKEMRPLRKPALRINDTVIKTDYYVEILKLFAQSQDPVAKANVADYALDFMQNNELIKQAAVKMGIVVTPGEIGEAMSKAKLPMNQETTRTLILVDLYAQKARDNLASTIPTRSDQAHVLLMLIEGKDMAEEIRGRVIAGEEFASIAKQFSLDLASKDKGGDLGWLPRELMDKNIADVVFTIEPGSISAPVSQEGTPNFYLLKVIERKNDMEISTDIRNRMISQAFSNWVSGLKKEANIEIYLKEKDKVRALELASKK